MLANRGDVTTIPEVSVKIIQEPTDAFCTVTIEAARPYGYVLIEEAPRAKWLLAPIFEDAADVFTSPRPDRKRRKTQ